MIIMHSVGLLIIYTLRPGGLRLCKSDIYKEAPTCNTLGFLHACGANNSLRKFHVQHLLQSQDIAKLVISFTAFVQIGVTNNRLASFGGAPPVMSLHQSSPVVHHTVI